jgi:hypothetical protein
MLILLLETSTKLLTKTKIETATLHHKMNLYECIALYQKK